jgi:DNA-binding CsgD family transcriptional regulator
MEKESNIVHLTERELEVLQHMKQGITNQEIAENLTITYHTVKAHIASILRKTGTKNRLEAVLYAIDKRLINPHQG